MLTKKLAEKILRILREINAPNIGFAEDAIERYDFEVDVRRNLPLCLGEWRLYPNAVDH